MECPLERPASTSAPPDLTQQQRRHWQSACGGWEVVAEVGPAPLDVGAACAAVTHAGCGAVASFLGTTRDSDPASRRRVTRLEYEAHVSLALATMLRLGRAVSEGGLGTPLEGAAATSAGAGAPPPPLGRVHIAHRTGPVCVAEGSIFVAVATPHRAAALQAVAWLLDELKARLPVWKREVYAPEGEGGGEAAAWKENTECPWGAEASGERAPGEE